MNEENHRYGVPLENRSEIGFEIKSIREQKGLSQEQLAQMMGVSRSTISKIENGKFSFSVDYLLKLSAPLDFKVTLRTNNLSPADL